MSHDDTWRLEAQTEFKNVETYHWGYRIACLNRPAPSAYTGPLTGIRFWFEKEGYYVLIGCPPEIRTRMAADGRWAKGVSKYWGQRWEDDLTPRNANTIWGFTEDDDNIYYMKGWGKEIVEALDDLQRRLDEVLPSEYECYNLQWSIMEGLCALDPSWKQTKEDYDREYDREHAKDVVQTGPGYRLHRDGTRTTV